jgi:hypothetical protein
MWRTLFDLLKRQITFAEDLQRLRDEVKEHGRQIRELTENQTRMYFELQLWKERDARERDREAYERRLAAITEAGAATEASLQLENQRLRERLEKLERLLPPASSDDRTDE